MFLAVLQGVSELFPVSSLGHTILIPVPLGLQVDREDLALIHICRCRRPTLCRSRWSPERLLFATADIPLVTGPMIDRFIPSAVAAVAAPAATLPLAGLSISRKGYAPRRSTRGLPR